MVRGLPMLGGTCRDGEGTERRGLNDLTYQIVSFPLIEMGLASVEVVGS